MKIFFQTWISWMPGYLRAHRIGCFSSWGAYFRQFSFSGLGYVVGQGLASAFGEWQYSMRGTPVLGTIAVLLIIFVLVDPPRGAAEGQENLEASSYWEDLKHLFTNKSFMLSTLGFTCVAFCTGALSWWGPKFLETSILAMEEKAPRQINISR